ncbi:MAG: excisionase [Lachnospiraceae bacterium]|nr:excisionase [Lachnospiraceae bacterium]MBQ3514152.1 excisionase [Lachnospiraceae bacterium]MBQ6993423.1 excisionase [Lachnospiraceae bacterium]
MKCLLMNKNMPVVELELDDDTATILKVLKTYELDFLPVGIDAKSGIPNKKELNEWWFGRSIPASRSGIRTALEKLNIQHSEQLLLKCYGLSLSDQYWMKPMDSELEWININFFDNNFSDDVGNILFGQPASQDIDLMSPCNTSDGWLKKKWKIIDGKRCLIKAGSNPFMQEPINEVFGTRLHQRLGCKNYVSYNVLLEDGIPYSVCENFIDTNTELVNAVSINRSIKKRSQYSSYEHFMNACEKLGIPGMKEFIDYMLVFDYLMANTDRHFGNFGAIRNVQTLEWIGPAPVFDSGTSLWHDKLTRAINPLGEIETKPFYSNASRQMELVSDFSWVPFEELRNLKDDIREIFAPTEFIDEERIEVLSKAVTSRVEELQEMVLEQKKQFTLGSLQ